MKDSKLAGKLTSLIFLTVIVSAFFFGTAGQVMAGKLIWIYIAWSICSAIYRKIAKKKEVPSVDTAS